jgi:DNA polymerase-4
MVWQPPGRYQVYQRKLQVLFPHYQHDHRKRSVKPYYLGNTPLFVIKMPEQETSYRKIIHVDMDAFYASVEQRDFPELRGKPVAVGGSRERGVVAAASYEARKFGVYSAMPSVTALRKCPGIIFIKPRFDVYRRVSHQIREIFFEYTDLVEPLSLDEAYLDVTENKKGMTLATDIAKDIKRRIKSEINLTASTGISCNKFLAKIASDYDKPDGFYLIHPTRAAAFVETLPIEKFHGIGKVTAAKMRNLGIANGADLKHHDLSDLVRWFGKAGSYYYKIARGEDNRMVEPDRARKSISTERTFDHDLRDKEELKPYLEQIMDELMARMDKNRVYGRTLTMKVKFGDFHQITRSRSTRRSIHKKSTLKKLMESILFDLDLDGQSVRLLGLGISNLDRPASGGIQLTLDF